MRTRSLSVSHLALAVAAGSALSLSACVSVSKRTARSTSLEEARVSSGVVVDEKDSEQLSIAIAQIERQRQHEAQVRASLARRTPTVVVETASPGVFGQPSEAEMLERHPSLPEGSGKAVSVGRLSDTEVIELLETVAMKYQVELGYSPAAPTLADFLPPGDKSDLTIVLARNSEQGLRLVRLSHRRYLSQAGQLVAHAIVIGPHGVAANTDVERAEPWTNEAVATALEMRSRLTLPDLEAQIVQLSYVDAASAMKALRNLGVQVVGENDIIRNEVDFARLPIVTVMPAPQGEAMTLIGANEARVANASGMFTFPTTTNRMETETVSGRSSQLLVMFHPAHPEQHSRVLRLLSDLIDVPARQVFIEGMVIEIGDEGLKELGVEWQFQDGSLQLLLGSLDPSRAVSTIVGSLDSELSLPTEWLVRLRALVTQRKAEILSRPSVVTLDNRQATIRVGTDIPVATSQEGLSGNASKISFDFRYIPTGILLNVRPRIDAESNEISLQIDTTVSAPIPGQDLELRGEDGRVLASAPTIASRRVQTYARIPNNTPLIIGGLVSRQDSYISQKVPLLGDLPLLGPLFQSQRWEESKREVIIVLTPYVLPETTRLGRMNPRSEGTFDISGFTLHRDVHRLREAEVFDLSFLTTNARLIAARRQVNDLVRTNFRFAAVHPFSEFTGERMPGEHILVERMMYEVIKNLELTEPVDAERIILFGEDPNAGYRVRFLRNVLTEYGGGVGMNDFFTNNPGKALAIRYFFDREVTRPGKLGTERIPEIQVVDCADRAEWGRLLWDMNQPDEQGRETATVLLHGPQDLLRLRRAIVLKQMAILNGGIGTQRLKHFHVGTMLQLPDIKSGEVQVIDSDVAKHFFQTEHYYSATIDRIEGALGELAEAFRTIRQSP